MTTCVALPLPLQGVYDSQIPLNIPESAFEALIDQQLDEEEEDAGGKGKKASKVQTQEEEEEVEEGMNAP